MIPSSLTVGSHTLHWGTRTYVMGIINITPDSFSGEGILARTSSAGSKSETRDAVLQAVLEQARRFVASGADMLDIGGESTRPGAETVDIDQEMERVIPAIRLLSQELDVLLSVDTYKAPVAKAALEAGAHIVNDVWGMRADPGMGEVVARYGAPVILMHNRSSWAHADIKEKLGGRYVGVPYEDLLNDVRKELMECVEIARSAGVSDERIILDPGIGFGKTVEQNLELLDRLDEIRSLGFPILLGASRKSFIGFTLDLPPDERLEGTAAAISVGIVRGADIVRVHDVEFMTRVAKMTDAIVRRKH